MYVIETCRFYCFDVDSIAPAIIKWSTYAMPFLSFSPSMSFSGR